MFSHVMIIAAIEMIGLLFRGAVATAKFVKTLTMVWSLIMAVPGMANRIRADLKTYDKADVALFVSAIKSLAAEPIAKKMISPSLQGVAFLECREDGTMRDLFDSKSIYEGKNINALSMLAAVEKKERLPVVLVDASQMPMGLELNSPGPVIVYGSGSTRMNIMSNVAIVFGNEQLDALGTILDAPLLVLSKLNVDNGIELRNHQSERGRVKLVQFTQLRSLVHDKILSRLDNNLSEEGSWSIDDIIQDIQVAPAAEPVRVSESSMTILDPIKRTAAKAWKRLSWSFGFLFVRGHLRFGASDLQGFLDSRVAVTRSLVEKGPFKFSMTTSNPRIAIEDQKVKLKLDMDLVNLKPLIKGLPAPVDQPKSRWAKIKSLVASTRDILTGIYPREVRVRDIEVEIHNFRVSEGKIFIDRFAVTNVAFGTDLESSEREGFQPLILAAVNEVLPRLLREKVFFDLRTSKVPGLSLARHFLEDITIEYPEDAVHLRFRVGPTRQTFARIGQCIRDLRK